MFIIIVCSFYSALFLEGRKNSVPSSFNRPSPPQTELRLNNKETLSVSPISHHSIWRPKGENNGPVFECRAAAPPNGEQQEATREQIAVIKPRERAASVIKTGSCAHVSVPSVPIDGVWLPPFH